MSCATGNCIRVAAHEGQILFGSTTDPEGAVIAYTPDEFREFLIGVRQGDFDHLLAPGDR